MKQLEITTNKRLLIVEFPDDKTLKKSLFFFTIFKTGAFEQYFVKLICKGPELTEDIAKGLVEYKWIPVWGAKDYVNEGNHFTSALESFISAIESKWWFWGDNSKAINNYCPGADPTIVNIYQNKVKSRTFNPSKSIIFEIV